MYATCLFCHAALGANESIEHFPVGKRLAFDAAKGRLWVVCTKCERWNLSPLDERWEAIEEAERAYRDTKKRVATDNIGLARLHDGTDLIRIGAPLRPEFAAWRYGDTFGKRRRYRASIAAGSVVAGVGLYAGLGSTFDAVSGAQLLIGLAPTTLVLMQCAQQLGGHFTRLRVAANDGATIKVTWKTLRSAMIHVDTSVTDSTHGLVLNLVGSKSSRPTPLQLQGIAWRSHSSTAKSVEQIHGEAGHRALSQILAITNNQVGSQMDLARALTLVEHVPTPGALIRSLPLKSYQPWFQRILKLPSTMVGIRTLPAHVRLAIEMSLHEADERRALEGELHELAQRWKDAEEIAAISDSLFLSTEGD